MTKTEEELLSAVRDEGLGYFDGIGRFICGRMGRKWGQLTNLEGKFLAQFLPVDDDSILILIQTAEEGNPYTPIAQTYLRGMGWRGPQMAGQGESHSRKRKAE